MKKITGKQLTDLLYERDLREHCQYIKMKHRYLHYDNKLKYILVDGGEKISAEATKKQKKWYKSLSYRRWYNNIDK